MCWASGEICSSSLLDRRQEAHIGHFVGLIDDHDFDGRERERLLAQQVLKAARAGDHDIGAGLQIAGSRGRT